MWVLILVWLVLLVVGVEACRRSPPVVMVVLWLLVPLLLLPWWLEISVRARWPWFLWAKTYSVTTAILWASVCRAWPHKLPKWAVQWPLFLIVGLNILEAVVRDVSSGNLLNASAGALLMLTMGGPARVSVGPRPRRDVLFRLGGPWVIAYTIWNTTFVYGNWSAMVFGQHVAVLGAALVLGITTGWDRWLQARAYTLGFHLIAYDCFAFQINRLSDTRHLFSAGVNSSLQVVSLVAVATLLAAQIYRAHRARALAA